MYEQRWLTHGAQVVVPVLCLSLAPFGASSAQDQGMIQASAPALQASPIDPESQASRRAAMSARQIAAETASLRFLYNQVAQDMGNAGVASNEVLFETKRVEEDPESRMHTHVQQLYRGVPVFGGEAIVHLAADGKSASLTDDLLHDVQVDTTPTLSAAEAVRIAVTHYGCETCLTAKPKVDLWVMRAANRAPDLLVYRVQLRREDGSVETALPVYFIDAHTGAIEMNYNDLQSGTGLSLYSGTRTINTFYIYLNPSFPTYFMEDHIRNLAIYDGRSTENSIANFADLDNVFNAQSQRAAVDAHLGTSKTLDYFKTTFNRNGLDGRGGPAFHYSRDGVTRMKSVRVHYGFKYNNGFWNGNEVVLGDGDGVLNGPNVSVDWLGHEWTHALTQYTANLVYNGESGALNESFSDVFGCLIERFTYGENSNTWKIFEKTLTPRIAGDVERDMESPHRGRNNGYTSDDQPDHYSERYRGTGDNGGVHVNSGIPNKAFHLVAKGGSHHKGGSMTGIGPDKAARIWYKALTAYMTRTTNFKGARTATLNAAKSLYGSGGAEYAAVAKAWTLVGVN
jgi:thermolysin